ncbi:hypothetical protein [Streptomyces hokutonensis]|uniref:hypothetical protein n=1 Tax=Streptomyces hokutonensis TaxID=1306990 RepID=UPI0033DBE438
MPDTDPRSTTSRARRASAGLTALAVALLTCGAAVEVTGNVLASPANGTGKDAHPTKTAQPPRTHSRTSEAPSPHPPLPPPTSPASLPSPTATITATTTTTGSSPNTHTPRR